MYAAATDRHGLPIRYIVPQPRRYKKCPFPTVAVVVAAAAAGGGDDDDHEVQ